jgi:hypothetical protein
VTDDAGPREGHAEHHAHTGRNGRDSMELEGIVRAPDFPETLEWVHASGRRLTLADFRGKVLLLDFWTYG